MRWYSLAEEERRACHAPAELEALGVLNLTLFGRWKRNAIFVLVTAYADESGTGQEPRIMLAAVAARAFKWHGFNAQWRKLLAKEGIPFSHIVAMENKRSPFSGWGLKRTGPFVDRAAPLMKKYGDFGMTVSLGYEDHREHYIGRIPKNARKESAYGVCARVLIESVISEAVAAFGTDTVVNFVFEDSQHFESARCAFNDLRDHVPEIAPNMGSITPGLKAQYAGLQAADLVASLGRRSEPTAKFAEVSAGTCRVPRKGNRMPTFHVPMDEPRLLSCCVQAVQIWREKRWAKIKAKRAAAS